MMFTFTRCASLALVFLLSLPQFASAYPSRYMYFIDSADPTEFAVSQAQEAQAQAQAQAQLQPANEENLLDPARIQELVNEALARSPFNPANLNLAPAMPMTMRQADSDAFTVSSPGDEAFGSFGGHGGGLGFAGPGAGAGFAGFGGKGFPAAAVAPAAAGFGGKGVAGPGFGFGPGASAVVVPTGKGPAGGAVVVPTGKGPGTGGAVIVGNGKGFGPGIGAGAVATPAAWAWPVGFGPASLGKGAAGFGPGSAAAFTSKGPVPGSTVSTVINNGPPAGLGLKNAGAGLGGGFVGPFGGH